MRQLAFHLLKVAAPAAALLIGLGADARADMITGLYDTGVGASNSSLLAPGATDTHFALSGPVGGANPIVLSSGPFYPGGYVSNTSTSQWVGPYANGYTNSPSGTYTYTETFSLGTFASASISGMVAADNSVTIFLNGNNEGTFAGYSAFSSFSITSGFQLGSNTLTFSVLNTDNPSPTGLQVNALTGSFTVPVPASILMMGFGSVSAIGFSGLSRFRRLRAA